MQGSWGTARIITLVGGLSSIGASGLCCLGLLTSIANDRTPQPRSSGEAAGQLTAYLCCIGVPMLLGLVALVAAALPRLWGPRPDQS